MSKLRNVKWTENEDWIILRQSKEKGRNREIQGWDERARCVQRNEGYSEEVREMVIEKQR